MKQSYFQYLETGNKSYLDAISNIVKAISMSDLNLNKLKKKFDSDYHGDRTEVKCERMRYAYKWFNPKELKNTDEEMIFKIWDILRLKELVSN